MNSANENHKDALNFIREYNECFYKRDLVGLKGLYSSENFLAFWDNHEGCDSASLDDHFSKISDFFRNGKQTESGTIEELMVENEQIRVFGHGLLVTAVLRYASAPKPGVRSTFCLVQEKGRWQAAHIHHSFDPNE